MHDLSPITALGGSGARVDRHGSLTCTEVPGVALASVAARMGREAEAASALVALIGADAPGAGQGTDGAINAFWTGPDQWMIEAPFDSHEDIAALVKDALGDAASVTEQTDAWTRFDLSGAEVLAALERLCALNTRRMKPGSAQRGAIHHLGCFVRCLGADRFALYGPRASAGSLHHAILTTMKAVA